MQSPRQKIKFLQAYLAKCQDTYKLGLELTPEDLRPSSDENTTGTDEEAEKAARIADEYGFNGTLFRNVIPSPYPVGSGEGLSYDLHKLAEQIETIPRLIAKIEKSREKHQTTSLAGSHGKQEGNDADWSEPLSLPTIGLLLSGKQGLRGRKVLMMLSSSDFRQVSKKLWQVRLGALSKQQHERLSQV